MEGGVIAGALSNSPERELARSVAYPSNPHTSPRIGSLQISSAKAKVQMSLARFFVLNVTASDLRPLPSRRHAAPSDGPPRLRQDAEGAPRRRAPKRSGGHPSGDSRRSRPSRDAADGCGLQQWAPAAQCEQDLRHSDRRQQAKSKQPAREQFFSREILSSMDRSIPDSRIVPGYFH